MSWLAAAAASLLTIAILLVLLFTSNTAWVPPRPAPTAQEVGAGRSAVRQLRSSRTSQDGTSRVLLGQEHLEGLAALATHGLRPDRLAIEVRDGRFRATGSHLLPAGRWLNVEVATQGRSAGFPSLDLRIGRIELPPMLSRPLFEVARWVLGWQGVNVPSLDRLVREVVISRDTIAATISLPRKSGLVDRVARLETGAIDSLRVVQIYCRLAAAQRINPESRLAEQVRRAFSLLKPDEEPAQFNRAAFVALAMFSVDERAGELAGTAGEDSRACRIAPQPLEIQGRTDLPKHWSLSAALAVGAGTQLAEAMGEWKELADSLSKRSTFALGDPTGFSFVDLAADRSGFRIGQAAASPERAAELAHRLQRTTAEQLLPAELLKVPEGLKNSEFTGAYGNLDDPRFKAMVGSIDRVLDRNGIQ